METGEKPTYLRVSSSSLPLAMMGRKERMEKEVIRRCGHGRWIDEGRVRKWARTEGWGRGRLMVMVAVIDRWRIR